jgi:hypothetical protein
MVDVRAGCEVFGAVLGGLDPALYSGTDCAEVVELLARAEKRCAGVRILFAARAAESDAHKTRGYSNPCTWLAQTSGISAGEAKAALETANKLSGCLGTREALLAGELSLAQAGEIAKTEAAVPGSEDDMLNQAANASLSGLRDEGRRRRLTARDPDDAEEAHRKRRQEREERHWQDDEGMTRLAAAWPAEVGVPVTNRLDAEVDALLRQARRDGVEPETIERLRADALASLILGGGGSGRLGRPEVVLVCDIAAFQRGYAEPGEISQVIGGGPVPVSVVREMAASAFIKAVLHNGKAIEHVAHFRSRYRSAELRTALGLGDPPLFLGVACVDCGRRYGIQFDHVDPFVHGGPTSYENLDPRCVTCHMEKTARDRAAGLLTPPPPSERTSAGQAAATRPPVPPPTRAEQNLAAAEANPGCPPSALTDAGEQPSAADATPAPASPRSQINAPTSVTSRAGRRRAPPPLRHSAPIWGALRQGHQPSQHFDN